MENNSDRLGFALIALSVVAFVLLAVNGTLKPTVNGFFNGFKDWQTQAFSGTNDSNKQYVTYYAYAWSADGQSQFTTNNMGESTVPNLVSPTDTSYGVAGNGYTNQRELVASLADQTKTLQDLGFKSGDKLTVTADVTVKVNDASAPGGTFRLQLGDYPWNINGDTSIDGQSKTYHSSSTIDVSTYLTSAVRGVELRLDNVPSTTTFTVTNVRFQNASGETVAPYVGKYSGLKDAKQSTNYKDYDWAYNGNYSIKRSDDELTKPDVTHTAYSWSSDGTDRYTTMKPNLNLLDGTRDFSGNWVNQQNWSNDGTYNGLAVKKRDGQWGGVYETFTAPKDGDYTFSAYVKSSGDSANIHRFVTVNNADNWSVHKELGNNFDWLRDSFTITLKANDTIYAKYEIAGQGVLWTAGHKWEEGSTATPYMPSASEVKPSDQPKYIGTYTDKSDSDSQDPTKYTWKVNPDYHE